MAEVANLAGVSHATVSRVINNRPSVAPETARAVRAAIEKLNYRPRSVRPGPVPRPRQGVRAGNVGVYIIGPDVRLGWLHDNLNRPLLEAIHEVARDAGLGMFVDAVTSADSLPPSVVDGNIDGALVYPVGVPDMELVELVGQQVPLVWVLSGPYAECRWDQVLVDDYRVGERAADYLLQAGCSELAFLNHNPNHPSLRSRRRGFTDCLQTRQRSAQFFISRTDDPDGMHMHGKRESRDLGLLVDELLASDRRPDGLFVPGDRMTARVYGLLHERGIRPGEDMLVVSVDNFATYLDRLEPRPASFDLNIHEMGKVAASRLLARIAGTDGAGRNEPPLRIFVPPRLHRPV